MGPFSPWRARKGELSGLRCCTLPYIHKKLARDVTPGSDAPRSSRGGEGAGAPPSPLGDLARDGALSDALVLLAGERLAHSAADWKVSDRDRLLSIFAHDLRTLLTVLTLNAKLFLSREGDEASRNGERMQRSIQRMDRLLSDLVDLSMLNQGRLRTLPRPLDLAVTLREAVAIFEPLARAKSLSLATAGADRPIPANIDPDRMFQVISNLLANAIRFTPAGGRIFVNASIVHRLARVEVRDTGPGVPADELKAIFDCYRQLEGAGREGLGLGLFISRSILAAHMGRIWVESRPGAGSSFVFVLPAIDPELLDRAKPTLPLSETEGDE